MAAPGAGDYVQPILHIPPLVKAGLASGKFFRDGGVVRWVVGGHIYKHLKEVPASGDLAGRAATAAPKTMVTLALISATVGAGATLLISKRRSAGAGTGAAMPACVANFEASLRAYVDAGRNGLLGRDAVERLIRDLDAVTAWAAGGDAPGFSFKRLEPVFDAVIAHTPSLSTAYQVELTELDPRPSSADTAVARLRKHLDMQQRILDRER